MNMKPVTVLIAEDAHQVREELEIILSLVEGVQVVGIAANGLEAVHQAKILRPDVVVMDLEMPVLNGYEAARQIKSCCPSVYLIALTVHGYEEACKMAQAAGIDCFVVKGAPVDQLVKALFNKKE
jgi:DNA-binding NarL/FixJ family response regulator